MSMILYTSGSALGYHYNLFITNLHSQGQAAFLKQY